MPDPLATADRDADLRDAGRLPTSAKRRTRGAITSRRSAGIGLLLAASALSTACSDAESGIWQGAMDTLPSGQVIVANPASPLWTPGEEWRLTEELRIGSMDADGPKLFGEVTSLAVDAAGRIYVLEGQAQEIRVFDPRGDHVRTIGREGSGPGEFARAVQVDFGPRGRLWVADPENDRVSVFDTTGAYLHGHQAPSGVVIIPWHGGFDAEGNYYYPVLRPSAESFSIALARHDTAMQVLDTLSVPEDPIDREYYDHRNGTSVARARIPYSPTMRWHLSPHGTFWGVLTGDYRLFELTRDGDTLRTVTRAFEPLPVTDDDRAQAREALKWFTDLGGEVDGSKIPSRKPAVEDFFLDDHGNLWIWPVTTSDEEGRRLDVFDPAGRYLGTVDSPAPLARQPTPVVHGDLMYAVTRSELDVPFVVRLRITRPAPTT